MTRCDLIFNSHKYVHNYTSVQEPNCPCGARSQTTRHVLLDCVLLDQLRLALFNNLHDINSVLLANSNNTKTSNILLHGDEGLPHVSNRRVVSETYHMIICYYIIICMFFLPI
jgi:hypothetical protein